MRKIAVLSAAVLLIPGAVYAQFQVGSNGYALDANTRVGSSGYNAGGTSAPGVTGNQIITGNVTGLGYFHGNAETNDPSTFRDNLGSGSLDSFNRQSNAAPVRGGPPTDNSNVFTPQPFYGGQTAVAPQGFTKDPYSGTYIQQRNLATPGAADINLNVPPNMLQLQLPPPGSNYLIGAPGAGFSQTILAPLPSGGVTAWQPGQGDNQYYMSRSLDYLQNRPDRQPADDRTIMQMRSELQQTVSPDAIGGQPVSNTLSDLPQAKPQPTNSPGINPTANLANPTDQRGPGLTPQPFDASLPSKPVGTNGTFATNQGLETRLPTASQQSSQVAELERRLTEAQPLPDPTKLATPDVSPNPLNDTAPPKAVAIDARAPGLAPTPLTPSVENKPPEVNLSLPSAKKIEPMKVDSLATGFHASGLQFQMQAAEDAMHEGKFTTAIARYDTAMEVVPNNGLVLLGRAHAELGGGYYERAEIDLRRAIQAEPALVFGQYNLRTMFGEKRLQYVINDLKQLAANDKKPAHPVLLLAYIAYNTGNEANASEWLQAAEERGMKNDPLIAAFKKSWAIPAEK